MNYCFVVHKTPAKESCDHFSCFFTNRYYELVKFADHWNSLGKFRWYVLGLVLVIATQVYLQVQMIDLRAEITTDLVKIMDFLVKKQ